MKGISYIGEACGSGQLDILQSVFLLNSVKYHLVNRRDPAENWVSIGMQCGLLSTEEALAELDTLSSMKQRVLDLLEPNSLRIAEKHLSEKCEKLPQSLGTTLLDIVQWWNLDTGTFVFPQSGALTGRISQLFKKGIISAEERECRYQNFLINEDPGLSECISVHGINYSFRRFDSTAYLTPVESNYKSEKLITYHGVAGYDNIFGCSIFSKCADTQVPPAGSSRAEIYKPTIEWSMLRYCWNVSKSHFRMVETHLLKSLKNELGLNYRDFHNWLVSSLTRFVIEHEINHLQTDQGIQADLQGARHKKSVHEARLMSEVSEFRANQYALRTLIHRPNPPLRKLLLFWMLKNYGGIPIKRKPGSNPFYCRFGSIYLATALIQADYAAAINRASNAFEECWNTANSQDEILNWMISHERAARDEIRDFIMARYA